MRSTETSRGRSEGMVEVVDEVRNDRGRCLIYVLGADVLRRVTAYDWSERLWKYTIGSGSDWHIPQVC